MKADGNPDRFVARLRSLAIPSVDLRQDRPAASKRVAGVVRDSRGAPLAAKRVPASDDDVFSKREWSDLNGT